MALKSLSWGLTDFFSFVTLYAVGRTPWTGVRPVARPLPTQRAAQTQNKRKQTPVAGVGFEPKTPVFERTKTVHALERRCLLFIPVLILLKQGFLVNAIYLRAS
jgi:hypothetical protein